MGALEQIEEAVEEIKGRVVSAENRAERAESALHELRLRYDHHVTQMFIIRATVDFQEDVVLRTADETNAREVGALLAGTKFYKQVEVEAPGGNVIWATYPWEAGSRTESRKW